MAIRKDIDDMLNNLKGGKTLDVPKNPQNKPEFTTTDNKIDNMSVDDLLSSLTVEKTIKNAAASEQKTDNAKKAKKKIIIKDELPDYEALRAEERKREKLEKERAAAERQAKQAEAERIRAEKIAAENAERERLKAEREAEKARIEAEKKARIEAEKKAAAEAAEKARIEAEKKATAEAAEKARIEAEKKARIEAEKKAAAEAAEKARIEAEKKTAAEAAEKARIEAEKKAAAEAAEKARIEAEKKAAAETEKNLFEAEAVAVSSSAVDDLSNIIREDAKNTEDSVNDTADIDGSEDDVDESDDTSAKNVTENKEKKPNKLTSALENILDENPDDIINQRRVQTEDDDSSHKGGFKKGFYAVFGVIFAALACIGLIAVIAKGMAMFGNYTSGDSRKEGFESVLYPAVIMDIESFNSPAELSSEQIITAAIWSMIMADGVTEQYELTFDVVIIPAADVESYAVKLFGEDLPSLTHTTVGPAESRFYYNEETKSYNVPVAPVTYTYAPEIREATKSGSEYTVVVDYIDELPSWLPKTSSKSVEFTVTETGEGYLIRSMRILSTNTNAV